MYPQQHRLITAETLRRLRDDGSAKVALTEPQQIAILDGSAGEDAPSWQRLSNWHFFRSNDEMPTSRWLRFDSRYRVEELAQSLKQCQESERYDLIGRLLHHIQDMSTPSHVTPIYHGGIPSDPYESWLKQQFQEWPLTEVPLTPDRIATPHQEIGHFYKACAEATLRFIGDEQHALAATHNGSPVRLPLSEFWPEYRREERSWLPGFARFGRFGRHFGQTNLQSSGEEYQVAPASYRDLANTLLEKACQESMLALRLLLERREVPDL